MRGKAWSSILLPAAELVSGILLLVNPSVFTRIIIIGLGLILAALGTAGVIRYFRLDAAAAALTQSLARGLGMMLTGCFCIFGSTWFIATFPVMTVLFGIVLLYTGLFKLQRAADLLRLRQGNPLYAGVNAALTILAAVVIILNPFATLRALWTFIGVMLILSAALDLIPYILSASGKNP